MYSTKLRTLKFVAWDHYQIILDNISEEKLQFKKFKTRKPKLIIGNPVLNLPNLTITITDNIDGKFPFKQMFVEYLVRSNQNYTNSAVSADQMQARLDLLPSTIPTEAFKEIAIGCYIVLHPKLLGYTLHLSF